MVYWCDSKVYDLTPIKRTQFIICTCLLIIHNCYIMSLLLIYVHKWNQSKPIHSSLKLQEEQII